MARTTNELLAGYSIPLRREKLEADEKFMESLETMKDEEDKENAKKVHRDAQLTAQKEVPELQVWLKDFPRTIEDF